MSSLLEVGNEGYLRVLDGRYLVEVLGVEENDVWVSFPGVDYPPEGVGAHLEFYSGSGYVMYHTQVKRGPKREGDGVVLERSETADERKHRTSWRVPTEFTVVIREIDRFKRYTAIVDNLSSGGALIRAFPEFPLRTRLELTMKLKDDTEHALESKVVFVQEASALRKGPSLEYGLSFTEVPPGAKRAITEFLYKRIRELYPKDVQGLYPRNRPQHRPRRRQP